MRVLRIALAIICGMTGVSVFAQPACEILAYPTTVPLGDYSVFGSAPPPVPVSITVDCVPPAETYIHLSVSSTSGVFSPRQLALGTERVNYNAYLDSAGTQIFGNGSAGTSAEYHRGQPGGQQNRQKTFQVHFIASPGADAAAGLYTDTLTVSLTNGKGVSSASFDVTINVLRECQVSTFTLPFGNYDPIGAHATTPLTANTTVNVFCTRGVQGQVAMSAGNNPLGTARQLAFGANRLQYNIFTDAGRNSIWNTINRINGVSTSKLTPLGGGLIGYGEIPAGQTTAPPGSYFDTLVATVTY